MSRRGDDERPATAAGRAPSWPLAEVVEALHKAHGELLGGRRPGLSRRALPSRDALEGVLADLRAALFPAHFGSADLSDESIPFFIGHKLDVALVALHEQVRRGILFSCERHGGAGHDCGECERRASEAMRAFAERLPTVRSLLASDLAAAFQGDPAATSPDEALFCYPGLAAMFHHRIAHVLHSLDVPLIPRIISEISHSATGIDIHPGAQIGASCFIDHGTGVVIGATCVLGERVTLYQGVTLGAKSFPLDDQGHPIKGVPRHPLVEDDVVIYAGATILGRVTIGRGSSIGGNVWLTRSVSPGSRVTQAQARAEQFDGGSGI